MGVAEPDTFVSCLAFATLVTCPKSRPDYFRTSQSRHSEDLCGGRLFVFDWERKIRVWTPGQSSSMGVQRALWLNDGAVLRSE